MSPLYRWSDGSPISPLLEDGPGFELKSLSDAIIHLPSDGVGVTLDNLEMLCVTDDDTKARRGGRLAWEPAEMTAELAPTEPSFPVRLPCLQKPDVSSPARIVSQTNQWTW